MKTLQKYPENLLSASIDERVSYFDKLKINHPIFDAVSNDLLTAVLSKEEEPLILVAGPSRVGKTTMKKWLENKVFSLSENECRENPGKIPFVSVEAIASGYGNFRWKDYYTRSLLAMKEPLIDKKVLYGDNGIISLSRGSTAALRHAMEKTLQFRSPFVFIVDEAQHLTRIGKGKLEEQLDCIKSIANLTGVKHVLMGTYELLTFMNQSAQLNNRSREIHFRRYDVRIEEEQVAFSNVIRSFQSYMPLKEMPNLDSHWLFLFERTSGCVGILKRWLTHALRFALRSGSDTITEAHIKRTAPSVNKAVETAEEIIGGEAALADDGNKSLRLSTLLGLLEPSSTDHTLGQNGKKRGNRHPGKMKPRRFTVGNK